MKGHELMFGLSHDARKTIVELLRDGQKRHLELCRDLEVSAPEVTRHCKILADLKIIRKNNKSMYQLTGMGQHIFDLVDKMDFLDINRTFFEEHDISMIPQELDTISALKNAEIIEGAMNVFDRVLALNNGAVDSINCIFEDTIGYIVMEHIEQLNRGIRINILIKEGNWIPHEYIESNMLGLEMRQIAEIPLGMVASESGAIIIPKHKRGILDYGFGFIGQDEFLRYCDYVFSYFWARGKRIVL